MESIDLVSLAERPMEALCASPPGVNTLGLSVRAMTWRGMRIAYVDEGSGPPLVLLHGAPMTSLGFVRVIRELRKSRRVLAPDLPGFGASEVSQEFGGRLRDYAEFVTEFCVSLHLRDMYLLVNDTSGPFGISAAARLSNRLAGLIVADTAPIPLTGRAYPVRLALSYLVGSRAFRLFNRRFNLLPWLVATVAPWLKPFLREERRVLRAQFDTSEKRDRVINLFVAMGRDQEFSRNAEREARTFLRQTPTLLLFGQFDPMRFVGGVGRFRKLLPRCTTHIVTGEEHFPILSSGVRVAEAVRRWMESIEEEQP